MPRKTQPLISVSEITTTLGLQALLPVWKHLIPDSLSLRRMSLPSLVKMLSFCSFSPVSPAAVSVYILAHLGQED